MEVRAQWKIQPEARRTTQANGRWTKVYGETIYGTRGGRFLRANGCDDAEGNKIYIHIFSGRDETLTLPQLGRKCFPQKLFAIKVREISGNDFGSASRYQKGRWMR